MKPTEKLSRRAILLFAFSLATLAPAQTDANLAENEGPPRHATISIILSTPAPGGPYAFAPSARSSGPGSGASVLAAGAAGATDAPPPSVPITPPPVVEPDTPVAGPAVDKPLDGGTRPDPTKAEAALAVNPATTVAQIRDVSFVERAPVIADVEARLDAATQFVANVRNRAEQLHGDARPQFQAALEQARQRGAQVRTSLRNLKTIAPEKFDEAREQLARDYEAYAQAFAQVESTGSMAGAGKK